MILVCNWKMNPVNLKEAEKLLNSLKNEFVFNPRKSASNVWIAPPSLYFHLLKEKFGKFFDFGLQNVFFQQSGAFTGEISPLMAKKLGAKFVILGHSERKRLGENLEMINKKVLASLESGLKVILCFGESLANFPQAPTLVSLQRRAGVSCLGGFTPPPFYQRVGETKPKPPPTMMEKYNFFSAESDKSLSAAFGKLARDLNKEWENQLKVSLSGVSKNEKNLILAYEPSWAISSQGIGAAPKEYLEFFLKWYRKTHKFPIFYGGSVNSGIIGDYLELGFKGYLIGSASLKIEEMKKIVKLINDNEKQ